ncbi:hypothetical protein AB0J52_05095 [Spirillospora sp. NPDC049652]
MLSPILANRPSTGTVYSPDILVNVTAHLINRQDGDPRESD